MDIEKFENRTLDAIAKSLKFQGIDHPKLVRLLKHRDRYFLIECADSSKSLFLRYDRWFFYIAGLEKLPPEQKRRDYTYDKRAKKNGSNPKQIQAKQAQLLKKRLAQADAIIKKLGST